MISIPKKVLGAFPAALPATRRTSLWLLKLMGMMSLLVCLLQFFGVIEWLAGYTAPLLAHLGLPGDAAVPFVSGALTGTYGGIASMMCVSLTLREATIVALMICLCHGLPMESAVVARSGSSYWGMTLLRVVMALVCAFALNLVLPFYGDEPFSSAAHAAKASTLASGASLGDVFRGWAWQMARLSVMVVLIIYALMVMQRLLEAYDGMRRISGFLAPAMRVFGLPAKSAYMWLVANVIGISYGSAVMLELQQKGLVSRSDANDANYHLVMNHSMIEDTIVFAALGISAPIILATRLGFALTVVWGRRLLKRLPPRAHHLTCRE